MYNNQWTKRTGAAVRIAVDGYGIPYVVNSAKNIYKWNISTNSWTQLPGAANDIGVSADGDLWVIGTNPEAGGWGIY